MVGVGQHARLEDGGQIGGGHAILVGLGGKDGKEVEDVEQELLIQGRQFADQLLVGGDGLGVVKVLVRSAVGQGGVLVDAQGFAEALVELEGDDGFGELIEVAAEDIGGVMDGVAGPVEAFSIALGGVKDVLEILDALGGAVEAEDAFDIGGWRVSGTADDRKGRYLFPLGKRRTWR